MATLRRLTGAALDLAFPAACSGCGREGAPLCAALPARRSMPGWPCPAGRRSGCPAELPAPLLQLEWCAPFAGPVRDALHDLKYAGERRLAVPLGEAVARRWARVGTGAEVVVPVPVHAERERAARLRPGRAHRRGRRRRGSGCRVARALERGAGDGRPVRARVATSERRTWPARSGSRRSGPAAAARDRRPLGPARR